jgi:hypothetical protein
MPFAAAQVGPAFRNEIAPRSGLLRVRYASHPTSLPMPMPMPLDCH